MRNRNFIWILLILAIPCYSAEATVIYPSITFNADVGEQGTVHLTGEITTKNTVPYSSVSFDEFYLNIKEPWYIKVKDAEGPLEFNRTIDGDGSRIRVDFRKEISYNKEYTYSIDIYSSDLCEKVSAFEYSFKLNWHPLLKRNAMNGDLKVYLPTDFVFISAEPIPGYRSIEHGRNMLLYSFSSFKDIDVEIHYNNEVARINELKKRKEMHEKLQETMNIEKIKKQILADIQKNEEKLKIFRERRDNLVSLDLEDISITSLVNTSNQLLEKAQAAYEKGNYESASSYVEDAGLLLEQGQDNYFFILDQNKAVIRSNAQKNIEETDNKLALANTTLKELEDEQFLLIKSDNLVSLKEQLSGAYKYQNKAKSSFKSEDYIIAQITSERALTIAEQVMFIGRDELSNVESKVKRFKILGGLFAIVFGVVVYIGKGYTRLTDDVDDYYNKLDGIKKEYHRIIEEILEELSFLSIEYAEGRITTDELDQRLKELEKIVDYVLKFELK